jgi:hypothetical protein
LQDAADGSESPETQAIANLDRAAVIERVRAYRGRGKKALWLLLKGKSIPEIAERLRTTQAEVKRTILAVQARLGLGEDED